MEYLESIFTAITDGAVRLPEIAVPAEICWQNAPVEGVGGNRLSPDAVKDDFAAVLAVRSADNGKPLAMMINYCNCKIVVMTIFKPVIAI